MKTTKRRIQQQTNGYVGKAIDFMPNGQVLTERMENEEPRKCLMSRVAFIMRRTHQRNKS